MQRNQLVLACGNNLRGDDGVGWQLAEVLEKDPSLQGVQVAAVHQLTPEWAETLSRVDTVIFLDCSANSGPGVVSSFEVSANATPARFLTHSTEPASLLALTLQLYGRVPRNSFAVAIGGASFELYEGLTDVVREAISVAAAEVKRILALES